MGSFRSYIELICHATVKAMSDEYENGFSGKISVRMSSREIGAEVLLSLAHVDNEARFDSVFEIPYKILLMKKVIIKIFIRICRSLFLLLIHAKYRKRYSKVY